MRIRLGALNRSQRFKLVVFGLLFGVAGIVWYFIAMAATDNACTVSVSPEKSTVNICTNISSDNVVKATATYTGGKGTFRLKTATINMFECNIDGDACTQVSTSSAIKKPNLFMPSKAVVTAPSVAYKANHSYKSCVTLLDSRDWQLDGLCTGISTLLSYSEPVSATNSVTTAPVTESKQTVAPLSCGTEQLVKSDGSNWVCSFKDEFDGAVIDRTKWLPQVTATSGFTMGLSPGRACYLDDQDNISVANGYLNLTVRKEDKPFTCAPNTPVAFTTDYSSGQVSTYKLFSQQYGRFEVKAKLPPSRIKGLQETLWLWPNDPRKYGTHPASGELDFGEFYSSFPDYNVPYMHYTYDGFDTATDRNIVTLQSPKYNRNYANCALKPNDFNTFTATWLPGYIQYDVNGKPCVVNKYDSTTGNPAPFDQPFFPILTQGLGVGGNALDPNNPPELPATLQIDYIRIWK